MKSKKEKRKKEVEWTWKIKIGMKFLAVGEAYAAISDLIPPFKDS